MKPVYLVCLSIIAALIVVVGADLSLGRFYPAQGEADGLVLPPNERIVFRTVEFEYSASTNSLGFRDREFTDKGRRTYRIAAVGDSTTFGWGVNLEDTWVKRLESLLQRDGIDVEIANLGRGGGYPRQYADVAERALPVLKPNLLLVGVLQGDDLAQAQTELGLRPAPPPPSVSFPGKLRALVKAALPHLTALGRRPVGDVTEAWKNQVAKISTRDSASRKRFDAFDPSIKELYQSGNLNPGLLAVALSDPEYMMVTMNLESPPARLLIAEMATHLSRIREAASRARADVLVVSIPERLYVSSSDLAEARALGFETSEEMLASSAPDDAIRVAAERSGLPFTDVTAAYRKATPGRRLFFAKDGHMNRDGHATLAELLLPAVKARLLKQGASKAS